MSCIRRVLMALSVLAAWLVAGAAAAESATVPKPLSREWADDPPKVEDGCEPLDLRYASAPVLRIASRKATDRVYLLARKQACADGARCPQRRQSYLVPGDVVFAGPEDRGFRCVYYGSRRGELIAGFVPVRNLVQAEIETALSRDFLLGAWRRDSASRLRIGPNGPAGVDIEGGGHWRGMHSVNEGQFRVRIPAVEGSPLVLRDDEGCIVVFERRGPYLLLNDNSSCGGMNVRFVGIYIRQSSR